MRGGRGRPAGAEATRHGAADSVKLVAIEDSTLGEEFSLGEGENSVGGMFAAPGDAAKIDALFAGFPAGTVSGAPKVRAMEIIAETEQLPRGPYAGCIGWLGLDDDNVSLDTGITIRSMWVKDGKLHWQAGGGIVKDSDPRREYEEIINKSRAMLKAIEERTLF